MTCVGVIVSVVLGSLAPLARKGAKLLEGASINRTESPCAYLAISALTIALVLSAIWQGNRTYAPEMYGQSMMPAVAEAFARGESYAVFDLNINIRELRNAHLARMPKTPDVMVLGASHWQEAHGDLIPHKRMYNAHVHRDYYEDMLGMAEMLVRHDKMPKQLIIAIRDKLLTPVSDRKDHLWLPGVPYYEAMARRLKLAEHGWLETAPIPRWREQLSLAMLHANVTRWYAAPVKPHATLEQESETLDILLPDGSIVWSAQHQAVFTSARTRSETQKLALASIHAPPVIDPAGVVALETLFTFLKSKGIEIYFAHPPFNPDFYNQVKDTPYMVGLRKVEELTRHWAGKFGARVIGSFNPADLGCTARMYIDAEHANAECLGKLFAQFNALDRGVPMPQPTAPVGPAIASTQPSPVTLSREHRIAAVVQRQPPMTIGSVLVASARLTPQPAIQQPADSENADAEPVASVAPIVEERRATQRAASPTVARRSNHRTQAKVEPRSPREPIAPKLARQTARTTGQAGAWLWVQIAPQPRAPQALAWLGDAPAARRMRATREVRR